MRTKHFLKKKFKKIYIKGIYNFKEKSKNMRKKEEIKKSDQIKPNNSTPKSFSINEQQSNTFKSVSPALQTTNRGIHLITPKWYH